ncbi:MAG TPA: hypothetical protein PLX89_02600 [Verrucomicrobiota bacterium]|nr:hypothetical protein [Verrucomicrobiales bacterium]HRI11869.1 hypothetical protein [Verrucomicrobiota bacterium]
MAALDDDADGKLSGAELAGLALWTDQNMDGVSDPGEVIAVESAGLSELQCNPLIHLTGIPWHPTGAAFNASNTRPTFDWFAPSIPEMARVP